MRVLVVEDDAATSSVLERALREEGDAAVVERNGLAAVEIARSNAFDVVVLDVMLPGIDGFKVVHRLRQQGCQTPILMLTARDARRDLIYGLNLGADDYLAKPFELDVFFARLRAVARRGSAPLSLILTAGDLTINTATREVFRKARILQLTRTEYGLLELLIRNTGRVVPRDQIIEAVWGFDAEVGTTNLDAFVHLLRVKVDHLGEPKLIHTVRGVGYTLRANK
jgi:two-component system copper resistance phosphate regulon response regulator CusR/two-component system response regulator MprA